jgi:hypothetical protein
VSKPKKIKKDKAKSEHQLTYSIAQKIGTKLAKGQPLTRDEEKWRQTVSEDPGDGEPLCAPVSFDPENEFCTGCANFRRCASRMVDNLAEEKDISAREP